MYSDLFVFPSSIPHFDLLPLLPAGQTHLKAKSKGALPCRPEQGEVWKLLAGGGAVEIPSTGCPQATASSTAL